MSNMPYEWMIAEAERLGSPKLAQGIRFLLSAYKMARESEDLVRKKLNEIEQKLAKPDG